MIDDTPVDFRATLYREPMHLLRLVQMLWRRATIKEGGDIAA